MATDEFRRVLIIAYYFPPLGLSGVQRTAKFAKYLSRYGWKPTVLTVEPAGYFAFDESLLHEMEKAGVEIVRTSSLDANRLFKRKGVVKLPPEWMRKALGFVGDLLFIPDTKIGWKNKAVKRGLAVLGERKFHAILATAPPQTDFLIGAELKRRSGLPLLLDYRDAWLEYPFKYFPTPLHRWLHRRLERRVLRAGDRVVVTHRRIKEQLLRRHRQLAYDEVTIISQGYDPEDVADAARRGPKDGPLVIAHAGTFYGGRSPETLFRAIHKLAATTPDLARRLQVRLIGAGRDQDKKLAGRLGLGAIVTFTGYVEHRECIRMLHQADVLWYVNNNDLSSPGKLYEYFATGRTILASVVEGYTRQQIVDSGGAVCVPLSDVTAHESALLDLLHRRSSGTLPSVSAEFVSRFDRLKLTGELARQLESLLDHDPGHVLRVQEPTP